MRLVDIDDETFWEILYYVVHDGGWNGDRIDEALDLLVKRGYWINAYPEIETNPMFMYGICSECGYEQSIGSDLPICPGCFAMMEVENGQT